MSPPTHTVGQESVAILKEFMIFNIYYKITTCVGQEETVVFLKEFITFYIPQNYYMCRTRGNCSIFEGIHYFLHTAKLLHV